MHGVFWEQDYVGRHGLTKHFVLEEQVQECSTQYPTTFTIGNTESIRISISTAGSSMCKCAKHSKIRYTNQLCFRKKQHSSWPYLRADPPRAAFLQSACVEDLNEQGVDVDDMKLVGRKLLVLMCLYSNNVTNSMLKTKKSQGQSYKDRSNKQTE